MAPLIRRSSWRYLWRHPWQVALAVLGVGLGVAVAVAVDVASGSAHRAFELSMDEVAGRATHQIVGGPAGVDEQVYARLRLQAGVRPSAPAVEGFGVLRGETVRLLGVDPFAEATFRPHLERSGEPVLEALLTEPGAVLLPDITARRLDISVSERLHLELGGYRREVHLVGRIPTDADTRAALDGLMIADIATVQELLGQPGRLSWIDLILPPGEAGAAVRSRIEAMLPSGASLVPAESRTRAQAEMTRAFRTNLTAMSLLALVVGTFLIYNTMTFAVLQRRPLIGALRVLGVTRGEVFRLVLGEALAVGLAGTVLGLGAGVLLGEVLVKLVARTIDDLYFALQVSELLVTPAPLVKGALLGLGATVLAALVPAAEAARTSPQAALHRSQLEGIVHRLVPGLAWHGAGLMVLAGLIALFPSRALVTGFGILFLLILGMTLMSPLAVAGIARALAAPVGRAFGMLPRLAVRGVEASLSRTGVAIAALMLAVATTVGVGLMVASFRATVQTWLESTLRADIYVAAPSLRSTRSEAALDPALAERIKTVPGIASIATGRSVTVESAEGLTDVFAIAMEGGRRPQYLLKHGDPERVWSAYRSNEGVLVSEPYAYRHDVSVGETIRLPTDRGRKEFSVVGIYYDYESGPGEVVMPRALYDRYYDDPAVDALGIELAAGAELDTVMARLREAARGVQAVRLRSSRELRAVSLKIFERTFTITGVLRLLAVLVAFIGILSALMALSLERGREMAILRATGFTPRQIASLVTLQSGFMGLVAGLLSVPVGLVLAYLLIHVINRRAFGWTMQTVLQWEVLLEAVVLAFAAALIAGLYPGWKMAAANPAHALREE